MKLERSWKLWLELVVVVVLTSLAMKREWFKMWSFENNLQSP
jgi:hypothetical protein